ncbi:17421_t:CDS:2 [Cetraspora pellucida]|uniref:17421_t:CDS:1 n=1 Tax=Cetraspora pellucida TaxID=1433469 RepID=A0A9N9HY94_9GLOM|nr:17421_t:CDS:2 [Cetraspora pellucida]
MPKITSLKYYAIAKEEKTGIFTSWKECKEYVNRYPEALYKSFFTKIKEHKGKTYLKHVKGHSSIYENEQADKLAYIGSKNLDIELILPVRQNTIKDYFK